MPRINEYLPETEGASPAGGLDPNLTVVGEAGRGIQKFGGEVTQALDVVDRRREQTETADAYSNVSQARKDFTQQLQQQTNDGTLNSSQFQQQYQDWVDDQSQNYSTPGGRSYFQRQTARLGSSLTRTAANGQTQIAFNNGKASWQQSLDNDVATVTSDPTQHDDIVASNFENLDQMVKDGRLKTSDVPAFQQQAQQQIAIGAIRGTSRQNPQLAQKILDDGNLNKVLSPAQQQQMYQEVKTAQTAKQVDQDRSFELQKRQQEAVDQHYMDSNFNGIQQGTVTANQILSSPLSFQKKNEAINLIKAANNQDMQTTNPQAFNALVSKIGLPAGDPNALNDPGMLYQYAGNKDPSKRLSVQDIGKLRTLIDQSPGGQDLMANRKSLVDLAKSQLVNKNSFMGQSDPDGEYNLMRFTNALQDKENELRQSGQSVSQLYDTHNKLFFGNNIKQFVMSPMDKLNAQTQRMQGSPSPESGTMAPNVTKAPATPPSGLSKQQFIKWKRDNGQ